LDKAEELRQFKKSKERIIDKMKNDLHFTYCGGLFFADSNLVNFIKIMIDENYQDFVIIDMYDNPIKIENPQEFYRKSLTHMVSVSNECYLKMNNLKDNNE